MGPSPRGFLALISTLTARSRRFAQTCDRFVRRFELVPKGARMGNGDSREGSTGAPRGSIRAGDAGGRPYCYFFLLCRRRTMCSCPNLLTHFRTAPSVTPSSIAAALMIPPERVRASLRRR